MDGIVLDGIGEKEYLWLEKGLKKMGFFSELSLKQLSGVTAGGGLGFQKADFDFAWIPFGSLGDTFRSSLLIKF